MILDCRKKLVKDTIRYLNPTQNKINFKAKSLIHILNWKNVDITEPPLTMEMNTEMITNYSKMSDPPTFIFDFPCHSQGCESFIPLLALSSDKVGEKDMEGYILSILESRKKNPQYKHKDSYNL